MTRLEALAEAEKVVKQLEEAPKSERGYALAGWKAPTFIERVEAILSLAEFLLIEGDTE